MSGALASEKRTARQVQPPSEKDGAGSLTLSGRNPAAPLARDPSARGAGVAGFGGRC